VASAAATQLVDVSVSRAPHDPPASTGPRAGSGRRRSRRPACDCPKGTPHGTPNGELRCWHLPRLVADVVEFLFFCPWRVGAARRLDWRDYSEADGTLTLRPEINKTAHELQIPVDAEHTPELMAVAADVESWMQALPGMLEVRRVPAAQVQPASRR